MKEKCARIAPLDSRVNSAKKGFTLIEISIALVIIGLLVGGILAAKQMIRNAEVRGVGKTAQQIISIVQVFKNKFGQYPGDSNQMWAFYGAECSSTANGCNGNNSGLIYQYWLGPPNAVWEADMEDSCVFRHLALASLWKGETLAAACSGGRLDDVRIEAYKGVVIPPAIEDVYYHVAGIKLYGRVGNAVNILTYSAGWSGDYMIDGHLTISDARVIEDKFDNGDPDSGKVYI